MRLSARYASTLRGSPIDVHKAWVRGATVYRLRVFGLSEAEAMGLCVQAKRHGGDCLLRQVRPRPPAALEARTLDTRAGSDPAGRVDVRPYGMK